MKLILALMTALIMTGCSTYQTHLRTGCIHSCAQWEQWEKEAQEKNAKEKAEMARWKVFHEAERAKAEALRQAQLAEEKRLDAQCAGYSTVDRTLTPSEQTAMETAVKDVLKDPWSAQFRKTKKSSAWAQCRYGWVYEGEVNAKNSYGGYGGFKGFTVSKGGVHIGSY